ncbi:hypothetical protein EMIT0194P_110111 [Pseudomonas serbica]
MQKLRSHTLETKSLTIRSGKPHGMRAVDMGSHLLQVKRVKTVGVLLGYWDVSEGFPWDCYSSCITHHPR